jgi:hypothetical protein
VGEVKVSSSFVTAKRITGNSNLPTNGSRLMRKAGPPKSRKDSKGVAFVALALFMIVYCIRPTDWIPTLALFPLAKIFGFMAIGGYLYSRIAGHPRPVTLPREMTYLVVFFIQQVTCIPFGVWPGGSFELIVLNFSEVVILTIILTLTLDSMERLWRMVFIQSLSVIAITGISLFNGQILQNAEQDMSRLMGAGHGVFENPNDLAIGIAMVFPLCFMFLMRSRGFLFKALWATFLLLLARTVLMTYSRGGFVALVVAVLFILYEFGIRGRRPQLFAYVGVAVVLLLIFAGPANYGKRFATIFSPDSDETGSAQARRELLILSLQLTAKHPIFGIGPGNFPIVSGVWLTTHNTFTELSAEAGVPAIILFLVIFGYSFKNIRSARQLAPNVEQIQLLGAGLQGATAAFLMGSFFASTAYHFFPYFLVAYSSAMCGIARQQQVSKPESVLRVGKLTRKAGRRKPRALIHGGLH